MTKRTSRTIRFLVEPRDVPVNQAARRLHLTEEEFEAKKIFLFDRGFPHPDTTTGMYDLKLIDDWMDRRSHTGRRLPNAADGFEARLNRIAEKNEKNSRRKNEH
ncbi:MAG TPA: hypothetical protein VN930_03130 [Xanthobacteraceae bacterium]|nr:hypothetical protein [Xanthobacteraceae bacterium]